MSASPSGQPVPVATDATDVTPGVVNLPSSIVDPVVADIASTAGVPPSQVTVLSAEPVTFPDGSLGCPIVGLAYTQIPVDGYRIVADVGGKSFDFRGTGATFRRCLDVSP